MKVFLFCLLAAFVAAEYYSEDSRLPAVTDDEEGEILIKKFNKCTKEEYFDLYTASCRQCTVCPKGKFPLNDCTTFDNTECASCANKALSFTRGYRNNCRSLPSQSKAYSLRDGMRGPIPAGLDDIHWKSEEETSDEFIDDVPKLPQPEYNTEEEADDYDFEDDDAYSSEDVSDESNDIKTVEIADAIPLASRTDLIEIDDFESMVKAPERDNDRMYKIDIQSDSESDSDSTDIDDSDFNSAPSSEEEDDDETNENHIISGKSDTSFKNLKSNLLAWNLLTKVCVFVAYCLAVIVLIIAFRFVQNLRRQRTFNVQPLVMTPEQHNDLIRTVQNLQNKRRGLYKYEPLEEFV